MGLGSWRRHSGEARPVGSRHTSFNKVVAFCPYSPRPWILGGGWRWRIGLQTTGKLLALSPGWSRTLWAVPEALGKPPAP